MARTKRTPADKAAADRQRAVRAMRQAAEYINAALTEMREAAIHFANADKAEGRSWSVDAGTVQDFVNGLEEFRLCDHGEAGFEAWVRILEARGR